MGGLTTYALLVLAAMGLGTAAFDDFSLYWAVQLVVVVGGFLPLEQIVARRRAGGATPPVLAAWAVRWGLCTAAAGTLAFVLVMAVADRDGRGPWGLTAVLAVNLVATTWQSMLRGFAAGSGRLDVYALMTSTDGILRTGLCGMLVVAGVDRVEAYAGAIALGCWGSVLLGSRGLGRQADPAPGNAAPHLRPGSLSLEALSLVPAMFGMQLLLNSPVLLAPDQPSAGTSAGALLAISSLVRTSVFVMQAGQAAYVAPIAGHVARRDVRAVHMTAVVAVGTMALALATAVGAAALGPWLVELLYGADFVVGARLCLAVGGGVAVFLLAIVANDLAVAWGAHRFSGLSWLTGVTAAVVAVPLLPAGDARAVTPIAIGSAIALLLTVLGARGVRSERRAGGPHPLS